MLQAFLRKLSKAEQQLEDHLTSNVFGTLQYTENLEVIRRFLETAVTLEGEHPMESWPPWVSCEFEFWPWLQKGQLGCEPDVLLTVRHEDSSTSVILVEAKHKYPKTKPSSYAPEPRDQLAREACCVLVREAQRHVLVFLTADSVMPTEELSESVIQYQKHSNTPVPMAWTNWRTLSPLLAERKKHQSNYLMLRDLDDVLKCLGFQAFRGIQPPPALGSRFKFDPGDIRLQDNEDWLMTPAPALPPSYCFEKRRRV